MRFCLILFCLWASACSREPLYQSQSYVFGTLVDISIYGEKEERAKLLTGHVLQEFQKLHQQLHAWQPDSELSQLNQSIKARQAFKVSDELAGILTHAQSLSRQSDNLFNPAIGSLIKLWGFQRDEFSPLNVEPAKIAELVKEQPSLLDIQISKRIVTSPNPAVQIDLGGYAKGYALDLAANYLRQQHVKNALINIGGNILALGQHGEHAWRVGIQAPRKPGPIATLDLPDGWAIGTSGDYQRYFEKNGKRYCHIINPYTGYPADNAQAVTILVPPGAHAGTLSDVASKPIFIAEMKNKLSAANKMGIESFLLVTADGQVYVSKSMAHRLQWTEPNVKANILE